MTNNIFPYVYNYYEHLPIDMQWQTTSSHMYRYTITMNIFQKLNDGNEHLPLAKLYDDKEIFAHQYNANLSL